MNSVIFGGSSGIGAAIARYLFVIDERRPLIVDKLKHPYFDTVNCEFPLSEQEENEIALGPEKFSHVYITFGQPSHRKFDDTDQQREQQLLIGNFEAVTSALRVARRRYTYPDSSFVLTSTVSSLRADPGGAIYASAKAGLNALVANLAREWSPARVNGIAPGPTATDQFLDNVPMTNQNKEKGRSPHGVIMNPLHVAQAAVELSKMRAVSGVVLPVDLAGISSSRLAE